MTTNLLSPTHIEKLGHSITEIRSRALQSVWSKYNMCLVDYSNLENAKLLLEKLMEWFNFENHPHEEQVLKLILKLLKQPSKLCIVNKTNCKKISMRVEEIKNCVDPDSLPIIHEIKDCIKKIAENIEFEPEMQNLVADGPKNFDNEPLKAELLMPESSNFVNAMNSLESKSITESKDNKSNTSPRDVCAVITSSSNNTLETSKNLSPVKVDYFTWQLLTSNDYSFLTSVYEGLRYFDNEDCVLQSCHLYTDILLKDFPIEVFLQRTFLVKTFFELLKCEDSEVSISALACLIATVKCLHSGVSSALDISVIHSKKYFIINKNKPEVDGMNMCMNLQLYSSDSETEIEIEEVHGVESYQYSVTQMCFSVISEITTMLSKGKSAREYYLIFELIIETVHLLAKVINQTVWSSQHEFKNNLYKALSSFHNAIKYHKTTNRITYSIIIHIIVKTLIILKVPEEQLNEVVPYCIQMELAECVSDYIFILLYPHVNSKILFFVERFFGQRKENVLDNYQEVLHILDSMKSAVQFLKRYSELKTKFEKLSHARKALPSLEFHRDFDFIQKFAQICLLAWSEKQLDEKEIELRKNILLKLLSHDDQEIKGNTYKILHFYLKKYLGIEMVEKSEFKYPGDMFGFLCNSEILTEMICHGLNSSEVEIQKSSSGIFIDLLSGRAFFSDDCWNKLMKALTPCLPLLQCFADNSTLLGRCILQMFDPDISSTILLSSLDLLRGNLRFLFSKNYLIRQEALRRLFWLLAKEDPENKKLPRLNLLQETNLSSMCSSVQPAEHSNFKQSFLRVDSLCNVMEMLTAENIEPSVRRYALSQLNVLLEDSHLKPVFLEQNGLAAILDIFKNCLIEEEFQNYPDSVLPVMSILKLLSLENPSVRLQLSLDEDVYYCILRGLLLFNGERRQGVELLCLLLYNECIINTHYDRAIISKLSLPQILIDKACLPFLSSSRLKCSKHAEPSNRETLMLKENSARLLRICWNTEWIGSISQLLSLETADLNKISPCFLPNDMILKTEDLVMMRESSFTFGLKSTLFDIQNATTRENVMTSLNKLNMYLLLYKLGRNLEGAEEEYAREFVKVSTSLPNLQWDLTFGRFFTRMPSCEDDEALLLQVVRILQLLLKTVHSQSLFDWIEKLLTDVTGSLPNIFKRSGEISPSLYRNNLMHAVAELIKDTIANSEHLGDNWLFYIDTISGQLILCSKHESCNIPHVECLMSVFVDITGNLSEGTVIKAKVYPKTITVLMEIILSLQCSREQSTFLGTNIIRNCLNVLNHILTDVQLTTKDWEHFWYSALSQVIGHNEEPNYCWLLSLWSARDPITRALAIQFFVGFSLTCHSCEVLIEGLYIECEYLRNECFKLLLDDGECNLLKEKAVLLAANLTSHGCAATATEFLQKLVNIRFYDKLRDFVEKLQLNPVVNQQSDSHVLEHHYGQRYVSADRMTDILPIPSTSLISAVSLLLLNTIFLDPEGVVEAVVNSNLLESLVKIFNEAPEACHKYRNETHMLDLIKMYSACCRVIMRCMSVMRPVCAYIQESQQFVNSLYCLVDYSLFGRTSKTVIEQRNQFWCEILDLLSIILTGLDQTNTAAEVFNLEGFKAVNNAMRENGTDYFISSLYIALSSYSADLRYRCSRFLTNLFGLEVQNMDFFFVADVLDRNISLEAAEQAEMFRWKGFTTFKRCDLNFAKRVCDILLQAFSLNNQIEKNQFKILVPEALGNLLAISKTAKEFCLDRGLVRVLLENLRKICIRLSLEKVDSLKKAFERQRINPQLMDIATCYRLLGNLLTGDEKMKSYIADLEFSSLIRNLWPWCTAKNLLHITTLKLLNTFTFKSESASRALLSHKFGSISGEKKSHGSATLLNTIILHIEKEIELTFKNKNSEPLRLSLQLLENCCISTECRIQMAKGFLISCFQNICAAPVKRQTPQYDYVIEAWYNFFLIFTSYPEGQLALAKKEVLQFIITTVSANGTHRKKALKILRNISFHQSNRVQLLSHHQFLPVLIHTLESGQTEEINMILHAIWGLISNCQKAKVKFKNCGLEDLLKEVKKKLTLSSASLEVSIVDRLLLIL